MLVLLFLHFKYYKKVCVHFCGMYGYRLALSMAVWNDRKIFKLMCSATFLQGELEILNLSLGFLPVKPREGL